MSDNDGLTKRGDGAKRQTGPLFSVSNFFRFKNIVISKKEKVITFNQVNQPYFRPKVKMQTGDHRHGATMKK